MNNQEQMDELVRLTRENNKMLRSLKTHANVGLTMKVLYWVIVLGFVFGAYYYFAPIMDMFTGDTHATDDAFNRFSEVVPIVTRFRDFFTSLNAN